MDRNKHLLNWNGGIVPLATGACQLANALFDWRSIANSIMGRKVPKLAVIANPRSPEDVKNLGYKETDQLPDVLSWHRGWYAESFFGDVYLEMFMIGMDAISLIPKPNNRPKIARAKEQLKSAILHAVAQGFEVIALTASTKRLCSPEELRRLFPGVFFTIGDNLTALALRKTIRRVMEVKSVPTSSRILVIGPSGFLGKAVTEWLISEGYRVVGLGSDETRASEISTKFGIQVALSSDEIGGQIDMIVACNHGVLITDLFQRFYRGTEIPIVDVCEPAVVTKEMLSLCKGMICRFDADVCSEPFQFVLGEVAESNMSLGRKALFPCWVEGLEVAFDPSLRSYDLLTVTRANQDLFEPRFEKGAFTLPVPLRSFGEAAE